MNFRTTLSRNVDFGLPHRSQYKSISCLLVLRTSFSLGEPFLTLPDRPIARGTNAEISLTPVLPMDCANASPPFTFWVGPVTLIHSLPLPGGYHQGLHRPHHAFKLAPRHMALRQKHPTRPGSPVTAFERVPGDNSPTVQRSGSLPSYPVHETERPAHLATAVCNSAPPEHRHPARARAPISSQL